VADCGVVTAHNSDPLIRYHINCIPSDPLYTRLISKAVDTTHVSDLSANFSSWDFVFINKVRHYKIYKKMNSPRLQSLL
jgi:hypothetical protein